MTMRAELSIPDKFVEPGGTLSVDLHVWNEGRIVDAYDLTLLGPPGEWGDHRLGQLPVYPGMHEMIKIPITVPRTGDLRPGRLVFAVRVASVHEPFPVAVPEAEITVGSFRDIDAELSRSLVAGRLFGSNLITLRNIGNSAVAVRLRTAPQDEKAPLRSRMRRSRVVLGVGEKSRIGVALRPARPALVGKAENWTVKVAAEWDEDTALDRAFTYRRRSLLTPGASKAAMILGTAVLAGAVLWMSPFGGGARTPRTQTAAGPAQLEQVNAAEAKARQEQLKETEQKRKSEQADKAPKKRQLQYPLFVHTTNGTKRSAYTVDEGYRLRLTTVQITAAGSGVLVLSADGKPLGSVSLSQAKDITPKIPVVVRQGRKVQMTVQCAEGTTSSAPTLPSASPSLSAAPTAGGGACTATALVNGELIPDKRSASQDDMAREGAR
ncbi:COG1470 family protein [Streptomyces kronopolitis]|uniref:COG1470 family protein n=1 Tax=Streptomyces kronopolitis TaxID=1612435 RepID=UPI0020C0929B|nr:hypothetical protein [Streptomyces kronopolitis]MCL6302593.1 hypothetical protein [Streptomyces kronopolitis]